MGQLLSCFEDASGYRAAKNTRVRRVCSRNARAGWYLSSLLNQVPMWRWDFSSAVNMNGWSILRVHRQENLTIALIHEQECGSLKEFGRTSIEEFNHFLCSPPPRLSLWEVYHVVIKINCVNGISACEREQTNPKNIVEAHVLLLFPLSYAMFLHLQM